MTICYPDSTNWNGYPFPDDPSPLQIQQRELAEALAWSALKTLTGGRLGICPVTVRPCKKDCRFGTYYVAPAGGSGGTFYPHIAVDGEWVNSWCGDRFDCGCTAIEEVVLPGPVGRVIEVQVDGQIVDPSAYRVDNGNHLVRQDGGSWPYCQDMNLPDGEVGTFSVTYIQGAPIDELWDYAAGVLAKEFYIPIAGGDSKKCRLPKNVQAITRQGVTFDMDITMFDNGTTGIQEVDSCIARLNPFKLKVGPRVMSPDSLRARRTTTRAIVPSSGFGSGAYGE